MEFVAYLAYSAIVLLWLWFNYDDKQLKGWRFFVLAPIMVSVLPVAFFLCCFIGLAESSKDLD